MITHREIIMKRSFQWLISSILIVGLCVGCAIDPSAIKGSTGVVPEDYGFSTKNLQQISDNFEKDVAEGVVPGAVALIARKGTIIYLGNFGMQVKENGVPMAKDSIFRIASMTKPITCAAALILYDQKKLDIIDPVSKYLPEFRNMKVGIEEGDAIKYTEPVKREMTIKDLMMHTSGLTYGVFWPSPIGAMYLKEDIHSRDQSLKTMTKKLGNIPLKFHPGTSWGYSRSTDVLGRVVEVASGQRLDKFMRQHIFDPLGMNDTGFYVQKTNLSRVAEPDGNQYWSVDSLPEMLSGGGGCVSTAKDYYRFLQMLLNNGELDGKRILKEETVHLMTQDHLNEMLEMDIPWYLPGKGYGFGFGVAVRKEEEADMRGTVGDYWWDGLFGPSFWVDPKKELIGIVMIQDIGNREHYRKTFREWVYNAVKD